MTTLMMILGGVLIGLGVGLMSSTPSDKKPWKPKKKFFSDTEMDYSKLHFK